EVGRFVLVPVGAMANERVEPAQPSLAKIGCKNMPWARCAWWLCRSNSSSRRRTKSRRNFCPSTRSVRAHGVLPPERLNVVSVMAADLDGRCFAIGNHRSQFLATDVPNPLNERQPRRTHALHPFGEHGRTKPTRKRP